MASPNKKVPLTTALFIIVLSMFMTVGIAKHGVRYREKRKTAKGSDPQYWVNTIIQTGPEKEALKTAYLAEILGLSVDQPISVYQFNPKIAQKRMLMSPVIRSAVVNILKPNTVFVDYTVRKPLAWLYDYENVAIDEEGYLFPVFPFFTPKNLPEIYVALNPFGLAAEDPEKGIAMWGKPLQTKYIALAFDLLNIFNSPACKGILRVKRIDVSEAYADSYGKRSIVVILQDEINENGRAVVVDRILRLSEKNYLHQMGNYLQLRNKLVDRDKQRLAVHEGPLPATVIDLRLTDLAYIGEGS